MKSIKRYIIDLDNTLVFTDNANTSAYNKALAEVGIAPLNHKKRITREIIFKDKQNIMEDQKKNIIRLKDEYFKENLSMTILNQSLFNILSKEDRKNCMLWTSGNKKRILEVVRYHCLSNLFEHFFFSSTKKARILPLLNEMKEGKELPLFFCIIFSKL